jgi:hypothetical protein
MKTAAMKAPTPAVVIKKIRFASSSGEWAFAIVASWDSFFPASRL